MTAAIRARGLQGAEAFYGRVENVDHVASAAQALTWRPAIQRLNDAHRAFVAACQMLIEERARRLACCLRR